MPLALLFESRDTSRFTLSGNVPSTSQPPTQA